MKLYEQYLFSDKIIIHKPDSLSTSKIFIIGLSGSGKTTLGEYLAKKYNRKSIKLDDWFWDIATKMYGKSIEELLKDKDYDGRKVNIKLEQELKKYKGNAIFDGVQAMWYDRDFILSNPVIMMGTSVLLSSYRAFMRNKDEDWSKEWSTYEILEDIYHNQKKFIDAVKRMREDIIKRNEYINVDSKEEIKI